MASRTPRSGRPSSAKSRRSCPSGSARWGRSTRRVPTSRRSSTRPSATRRSRKAPRGPPPDEFQRAYNFHGDQLRNRIRDLVGRAGGPEAREIPLLTPPFGSGPMDAATMVKWQRSANIEARILETAAKSGASPVSVLKLETEPAPADDPDVTLRAHPHRARGVVSRGPDELADPSAPGVLRRGRRRREARGAGRGADGRGRLREASGPPAKRLTVVALPRIPFARRSEQPR